MSIAQFTALFSLIGNTYGGNAQNNFALPDLRGRVSVGAGPSRFGGTYKLGKTKDNPFVYVRQKNLPNVSVDFTAWGETTPVGATIEASAHGPDTNNPNHAYQGTFPPSQPVYASSLTEPPLQFASVLVPSTPVEVSGKTAPLGQAQPIDVRQPYQVLNWQICIAGVYPSRGGRN